MTGDHPAKVAEEALAAIRSAGNPEALERLRVEYLGSRGRLQAPDFGSIPKEEKAAAGQAYNAAKRSIQDALEARAAELARARLGDLAETEAIDVTFPGREPNLGR
ncbi:MAG: phenylalanine--tRNA ligase subunit alpha, partial [Candidatus Dormibacteraeota bacterium]|nr:phenylalanine--tRNA ligase subunit alpha [Candidatus Dormibacteraeota bacterium]